MIIKRNAMNVRDFDACHDGVGVLVCRELFTDYAKTSAGFQFVHEDVLQPGVSIGLHTHHGNEEIYLILEGQGIITMDGTEAPIGTGDLCLTQDGHSHSLRNNSEAPIRLLVVCANLGRPPRSEEGNLS